MKPCNLAFVFLASFVLGCGHRNAEDVNSDQAGQHLRTALEAWKAGKSKTDLEGQSPSVLVNDPDWSSGNQLLDFKMDDAGRLEGRQMLWEVQLKLQDTNGKVSSMQATYVIDTNPRIVILRNTLLNKAARKTAGF